VLADEAVVVQLGGVAPSTARPTLRSPSPTRVSLAIMQVKALLCRSSLHTVFHEACADLRKQPEAITAQAGMCERSLMKLP